MRFLIPSGVKGRNLHRIKNAALFNHKLIAITEMTLFLFQMAILAAAMSACSRKMAVAQRGGSKRTCEARPETKRQQRPCRQRSGNKISFLEREGHLRSCLPAARWTRP